MIEEKVAVAIATRFLKERSIDVERFSEALFVPEDQVWACCFDTRMPPGAVDAPGLILVDVNCVTGEPSFFQTL